MLSGDLKIITASESEESLECCYNGICKHPRFLTTYAAQKKVRFKHTLSSVRTEDMLQTWIGKTEPKTDSNQETL